MAGNRNRRVGATGDVVDVEEPKADAKDKVVTAEIAGQDPAKMVTVMLAHPLNERDRQYLGLPLDAVTEPGTKVRVNRNGARGLITSGLAAVDPEDDDAVKGALSGGEPVADPGLDPAGNNALTDPPSGESTPGSDGDPSNTEGSGSDGSGS